MISVRKDKTCQAWKQYLVTDINTSAPKLVLRWGGKQAFYRNLSTNTRLCKDILGGVWLWLQLGTQPNLKCHFKVRLCYRVWLFYTFFFLAEWGATCFMKVHWVTWGYRPSPDCRTNLFFQKSIGFLQSLYEYTFKHRPLIYCMSSWNEKNRSLLTFTQLSKVSVKVEKPTKWAQNGQSISGVMTAHTVVSKWSCKHSPLCMF